MITGMSEFSKNFKVKIVPKRMFRERYIAEIMDNIGKLSEYCTAFLIY